MRFITLQNNSSVMKRLLTIILFTASLLIAPEVTNVAYSQPPPPTVDPEVPIDGGLTALVVAGLLYGARKLRTEEK